jgi:hypothetical protein
MNNVIEYDFTIPEYIYRNNLIDSELELFRYNLLNSFTIKYVIKLNIL